MSETWIISSWNYPVTISLTNSGRGFWSRAIQVLTWWSWRGMPFLTVILRWWNVTWPRPLENEYFDETSFMVSIIVTSCGQGSTGIGFPAGTGNFAETGNFFLRKFNTTLTLMNNLFSQKWILIANFLHRKLLSRLQSGVRGTIKVVENGGMI